MSILNCVETIKDITMERALELCGLTEKEFIEKIKQYGLDT